MPQLGESVHEGTIGRWLVKPGDSIQKYDPICEVITDKVTAEVTATDSGRLGTILVQEGETVEVGTAIASIEPTTVGEVSRLDNAGPHDIEAAFEANLPTSVGTASNHDITVFNGGTATPPTTPAYVGVATHGDNDTNGHATTTNPTAKTTNFETKPHRFSPVVRRIAREHDLDLDTLSLIGTGLGGRITRDDLMSFINSGGKAEEVQRLSAIPQSAEAPAPVASRPDVVPMPQPTTPFLSQAPVEVAQPASRRDTSPTETQAEMLPRDGENYVGLTPMRRAIANHMVQSKTTVPHAWTMVEVDMTALVAYRTRVKAAFEQREGVGLTYVPFMLRAVIEALRQFPTVNAAWAADGNGIVVKRDINLGIAVDVPDGLIVPVIHKADEKSLVGLARAVNDLATRGRMKKLSVQDVQGGTFTVNNPGAFGSVISYPVINAPQAAIITMEATIKRPVVRDDAIAIRSIMNMGISFDHRVIDGATAGRFLQSVKKWLEGFDPQGNLTTW